MSGQPPVLLVVDDERAILDVVSRFGQKQGYEVVTCGSGAEAVALLRERAVHLALVDLRMPDVGGLDVLRAIREVAPQCQAVLMTGYASIDSAVEAVKLGAMDYLSKPLDFARLESLLTSFREDLERRTALFDAEADLARRLEFCGMIARSPAMQELFALIRRLAPHVRTALIAGETGTGKELVARALHALGPRRDKRFLVVDCSNMVDAHFEGELFGQGRGADGRPGVFELADGGMLFLDDVGELPLPVQGKLLRAIEHGEVHRSGSLEPRHVDVQVLAATSHDLRADMAAGRFRADLFYRLNIVEIHIPPLRERREDIPYLTAAFIRDAAARLGKPVHGVTAAAERLLVSAPWQGNVRELRNVIERACLSVDGDLITERELAACMPHPSLTVGPTALAAGFSLGASDEERQLLSTVEREHIMRALQRAGGNKKAAARMLGLSRRALYRRLERLDLGTTIQRRKPAQTPAQV